MRHMICARKSQTHSKPLLTLQPSTRQDRWGLWSICSLTSPHSPTGESLIQKTEGLLSSSALTPTKEHSAVQDSFTVYQRGIEKFSNKTLPEYLIVAKLGWLNICKRFTDTVFSSYKVEQLHKAHHMHHWSVVLAVLSHALHWNSSNRKAQVRGKRAKAFSNKAAMCISWHFAPLGEAELYRQAVSGSFYSWYTPAWLGNCPEWCNKSATSSSKTQFPPL